ncbi:hypothetical protein APE02nite_06730 [Alkalibacterium pelagium]|uniref:Uncharacterized protein n=1 Tax=Alkalibacterium pelagium TaxID=426702 RepID=A0A1H7I9I2_9LACT|nr:hypothetical protein APE02nite_06730 [Alkalibacterium pelagium]SEK59088.1 hypothetical protein SAMN04488099_10453 [Alkalibacterium pelagium]
MTKLLGLTGRKLINIKPHAANTTIGISDRFILTNKLASTKKDAFKKHTLPNKSNSFDESCPENVFFYYFIMRR